MSVAIQCLSFVAGIVAIYFVFAPRNQGKTLDEIQRERRGVEPGPRTAPVPRTS